MLVDHLALWKELDVDDALQSKNAIGLSLILDFDYLAFFGLGDPGLFH